MIRELDDWLKILADPTHPENGLIRFRASEALKTCERREAANSKADYLMGEARKAKEDADAIAYQDSIIQKSRPNNQLDDNK